MAFGCDYFVAGMVEPNLLFAIDTIGSLCVHDQVDQYFLCPFLSNPVSSNKFLHWLFLCAFSKPGE